MKIKTQIITTSTAKIAFETPEKPKKKNHWDIIVSSNQCGEKVPYADYISCHHWENRTEFQGGIIKGDPLKCCEENCPIKIKEEKKRVKYFDQKH